MENKVDYTISRQAVEQYTNQTFTDREWEVLASDIESFIDYALYQQLEQLLEELPQSIADDDKYNS
jgi:hypothetical protein